MPKSMGFRNSGKLDFRANRKEYAVAGALLVVIVLAVVLVVGQIWSGEGSSKQRPEPRVKCVKCNAEWAIDSKDVGHFKFNREMTGEGGSAPAGSDCEKCNSKGTVFMMNRCPKCEKYYLSKRITDPQAFANSGGKEICTHCGTDLVEWRKNRGR